jgi:phage/plasmid primase-like uncharacterized protein
MLRRHTSDSRKRVVAFNSYRFMEGSYKKRYFGKTSLGISVIKDGRIKILSEGLVNALSVYQAFKDNGVEDVGVVVAGDASNLEKLTTNHKWLFSWSRKIIIALDYDRSGRGQEAAYNVIRGMPNSKIKILEPPSLDEDWNDLLVSNKIQDYI